MKWKLWGARPGDRARSSGRKRGPAARQPFLLESLEPRILLSASPISEAAIIRQHDPALFGPVSPVRVNEIRLDFGTPNLAAQGPAEGVPERAVSEILPPALLPETAHPVSEGPAIAPTPAVAWDGSDSDARLPGSATPDPTSNESSSAEASESLTAVPQPTKILSKTNTEQHIGSANGVLSQDVPDDSLARGPPPSGSPLSEASNKDPTIGNESAQAAAEGAVNVELALSVQAASSLLDDAISRWSSSLLTPQQIARLQQLTVQVTDLPNGLLGQVQGTTILIDTTAAGHGWFIDSTPSDDSEFTRSPDGTGLVAQGDGPASGRMDLLTVLMYEVGQVLGVLEAPVADVASPLPMACALATGQRVMAPTPVLDLSGETGPLTITVMQDGGVTVGGSASLDGSYCSVP